MKILFVITGLNQGGAEEMLYKLLFNINRNKFQCAVVSLKDAGVYREKISALNIPVHCLNKKVLSGLVAYTKFFRKYKPDIIQGWMYHGNLLSIISKLFYSKVKIIFNIRCSLNNIKDQKPLTQCIIKLNTFFSYFVEKVINNSRVSIIQHRNIGFCKKNELYIANGFRSEIFNPNIKMYNNFRKQHNLEHNVKIIGNVARFHPVKNHIGLIDIFSRIKALYKKKITLVMAGKNIDKNNRELMDEIYRLHLENDCILLGQVNSFEIIPAFDVYCSSSWAEGFPNVLGEAMLCGVPCVATDVGDCKTIINDFGFVASVGDYEALAKGCIEMLSVSAEKKRLMRQHIIDNYSIENITKQYEDLYESVTR